MLQKTKGGEWYGLVYGLHVRVLSEVLCPVSSVCSPSYGVVSTHCLGVVGVSHSACQILGRDTRSNANNASNIKLNRPVDHLRKGLCLLLSGACLLYLVLVIKSAKHCCAELRYARSSHSLLVSSLVR